MGKQGPDFYDESHVFEYYTSHRSSGVAPNENIEQPILWNLIGDPKDKAILDLGCGDARVAKKFRKLGAKSYLGIEGSKRMVDLAKGNVEAGFSDVQLKWIQDFSPLPAEYDLSVSSLALHYIEDLKSVFQKVFLALKAEGRFIFSVEHPVITSSHESLKDSAVRGAWIVDNYFVRGKRQVEWMGGSVMKYHRTIEDYLNLVSDSGFSVESFKESEPFQQNFKDSELLKRRQRIPLFLLICAKKT